MLLDATSHKFKSPYLKGIDNWFIFAKLVAYGGKQASVRLHRLQAAKRHFDFNLVFILLYIA